MGWVTERHKALFFWVLIVGNIFGAIGGFLWWYKPQLFAAPWYLWLFTPDSPLYSLLFGIIFAGMLLAKKHGVQGGLFSFLVSVGLLKYGAWTVASQIFVFFIARDYVLSSFSIIEMIWLVVSHMAMFLEGPLLLHRTKEIPLSWVGIVFVWFLLNDYTDYVGISGFTTVTTVLAGGMTFYIVAAVIATLICPFLALWYQKTVQQKIAVLHN